jgi:hypothetical protein
VNPLVDKALEGMGVAGAIISVLISVIVAQAGVIVAQWKHSNKVYGYRLAERDTLNKTLSDSTAALHGMLRGLEERNDITEDQAELIQKQSAAFEILRIMLLAQYENTEQSVGRLSQAVSAQAEAIRTINAMMVDSKYATGTHITEIKQAIVSANQGLVTELRNLIGNETTIVTRRRKTP